MLRRKFTMDSPTTAKLISLPTAFMLSGYYLSASQNTLPNIYKAPTSIATQTFDSVYHRGMPVAVAGSLVSTAGASYLAFMLPGQRTHYGAMAGIMFSGLPFTRIVMMRGIKRLIGISKDEREADKAGASGEAEGLLRAWAAQNYVRCLLSLAAGMVGLFAALVV